MNLFKVNVHISSPPKPNLPINTLKVTGTEPFAEIVPTPMRTNPIYIRVYILWMNLFVQILIPFLILIILNTFIYKKIKGFEKRSRESRDGNIYLSNLKVSLKPQTSRFINKVFMKE